MLLTIFDLINFQAFSSLWYWALMGLIWVRAINLPLGLPIDLLRNAGAGNAQAQADLEACVAVQLRRRASAGNLAGTWQVGLWAFTLTALAILAVGYQMEVAQALFLLAVPQALISATTGATARRLLAGNATGADLRKRLYGLKLRIQTISLSAVFISAVWGMYHNLATYSF